MKLTRLSYHDVEAEWGFEDLRFFTDVSLLVGASGVGKTRILKAIRQLRNVANDTPVESFWGVDWSSDFQDKDGKQYFWTGAFERRKPNLFDDLEDEDEDPLSDDDSLEQKKPAITREQLLCDGNPVFSRAGNKFTLRGTTEVKAKLSPHKSGFSLLSEEDDVKQARSAISQMLFVDAQEDRVESNRFFTSHVSLQRLARQYTTVEKIRASSLNTHLKLALVYEHDRETFDAIVESFREVFPYIEEVKISRRSYGPFADVPVIHMKERGVPGHFTEYVLSSGMRRTLMHLARLALWPDGTLILIDEFENSLGSNCIDAVAHQLLGSRRRLQFVITSHHPYIINTIPKDRWKIIARDKGRIKNFAPSQLGLDEGSKHEAFLQLINTDVFKFGTLPNESLLSS